MAWSTVETHIANPAGKRSNMTAKQIKYFGTKRQKAALKAKRKKKNRAAPKRRHAKRTAKRRNPSPRPKKRAVARHASAPRRRTKKSHRRKTRRNPELVSFLLGNPAGGKKVAHKTKKRATARHTRNAGTRRRKSPKTMHHRRRRQNPAGIPLRDFGWGGAGVLGGFLGSAALPQMFLGGGNTGVAGYAATAAAGIGLTILTHMFTKNKALVFGVGAGAAANLLRRVISDQTPFGGYLSAPGMGDYMVANWGPPIMSDGLNSAMASVAINGPVAASSGINMLDYADIRGGSSMRPC
jgi:hypothetical protein